MPEVFSPQVITREIDISTVAPSVSSSIAAIVGGAIKGPVNERVFISTPNQFVEIFGKPTPSSFLGYAAINYLRNGNQLWVTRVASLAGEDGLATANTDTNASILSEEISQFGFSGNLDLLIDGEHNVTIEFSPATTGSLEDIAETINGVLHSYVPYLGTAKVEGSKIRITTKSKNGPLSRIVVVNDTTPNGIFFGKSASGERTVQTETALTAASVTSANFTTIDTTVTYASATGASSPTFNVSKQSQEAYAILSVSSNDFVAGAYNRGSLEVIGIPSDANTLTIGSFTIEFDTDNSQSVTPDYLLDVTGYTNDSAGRTALANKIAEVINKAQKYASGIPAVGVTAVASGSVIELKQIDPDPNNAVSVSASNSSLFELDGNDVSTSQSLSGGASGSYIEISVPGGLTSPVEDNVTYYFLAGEDFSVTGLSTNQVASSIADAIKLRNSYYPEDFESYTGKTYALSASASGNQINITTAVPLGEDGNGITVNDFATNSSLDYVDIGTNNTLSHGFDARPNYVPFSFTVDGVQYSIDFDTIPSQILLSKHEATAQQIADAINFSTGSNFASATTSNEVVITSPTPGVEGSVSVTASSFIGSYNDPFPADIGPVSGTGDNHLTIVIDEKYTVDVFFRQDAAKTPQEVAEEINAVAASVDSKLGQIASVSQSNDRVTITSPTKGSFEEFGSAVRITNTLSPIFTNTSLHIGTGSKINSITISATTPGSWANDVVEVAFTDEDERFFPKNSSRVDVYLNGQVVESYRGVTIDPESDTFIEKVINGSSEYIVVDFDDDLFDLNPDTKADSVKIIQNTSKLGERPPYKLTGGADGISELSDADIIGVPSDENGKPTGLQTYANPDDVFINLIAAPGWSSQAVTDALVALAEQRQDILAVIDPPMGLSPEQVVDWHNGQGGLGRTSALNTSYAALYGSWLKQFDSFNNIDVIVPPSAHILSQIAYSDKVSEPWFAPAGLNRGRLTLASDVLNNPAAIGQRELMYGNGNAVNPIVKFNQEGIVIWGQKTLLRQESALNRINVRRLLNTAKTIISLAAKVVIFEPNDDVTIQRLIGIINPVLADIQSRRGIRVFKVENATTDRDRNLNRIKLRIFIQPTRTVEIIDIPFVITKEGGSFAV